MMLPQIMRVILGLAIVYGVDPLLATDICRLESDFDPTAVGDDGLAVGLWQWHMGSWAYVRDKMGESQEDERLDVYESTRTAMFALGALGLHHWWSAYPIAKRNVYAGLRHTRGR